MSQVKYIGDAPLVVLEQMRNNKSKHQYENRSRGTSDPESVLPNE